MAGDVIKAQTTGDSAEALMSCNKRRMLIVDDERSIHELFRTIVSCQLPECRIDVAVNGVEAVEAFRQARHEVLIMDIKMPIMNGERAFDEIRKICETEKWQMPSVIFCTGFSPSPRILEIIAAHPEHCLLMKPIKGTELLEAMKSRLSKRAMS